MSPALQRASVDSAPVPAVPPAVHDVLRSPGRPLDAATRSYMEPRFGHDFSGVRVHTDDRAAASVQALNARAYTAGADVVFGEGRYAPQGTEGRRLLAHELAHVVQQQKGMTGVRNANQTDGQEREARETAATVGVGGLTEVRGVAGPTAIQLSPLRDRVDVEMVRGGKSNVFAVLRARGASGPISSDPDLSLWLDAAFGSNANPAATTDDRWLADQLVQYGSEPHWPMAALTERERRAHSNHLAPEAGDIAGTFDTGAGKTAIQAYYFPGTSSKRAMIIGGVHGTEAAGVEVVNLLLQQMRAPKAPVPFFTVIIVPVLFADNLAGHQRKTPGLVDPNRQMPAVGATPGAKDAEGRAVERENQVLLDLIEWFQPERIASVHGHSPPKPGGQDMPSITDDPRPGNQVADDALALKMAKTAASMPGGARVPGNRLGTPNETSRYPTSSAPHEKGVSFGEYGSHATPTRPAMNVITIETYGNATSAKSSDSAARKVELESLATVLRDIFLAP